MRVCGGRSSPAPGGWSQAFLAACRSRWPEATVTERDLTGCELPVLTGALAQERDRQAEVDIGGPMFEPAREMAQADLVVIGAPDWDMTFPAALKIYLEWTCTLGITFHYTRDGVQEGLCRAKEVVYITTAGGPLEGKNFGFDYVGGTGEDVRHPCRPLPVRRGAGHPGQ